MNAFNIRVTNHTRKGRGSVLNPFFKVLDVPLERNFSAYPDLKFTPEVKTNQRDFINGDTGKRVGTASGLYKLTTHREAQDIILGFLEKIGIEHRSLGIQVAGNGAVCYERFIFPSLAFNPAKDIVSTAFDTKDIHKDDLIPSIGWTNSYNRTTPLIITKGLFRVACENGSTFPHGKQVSLRFRHNKLPDVELVRKNIVELLEESSRLGNALFSRLNSEGGQEYLEAVLNTSFTDKFKRQVVEKLQGLPGNTFDIHPRLNEDGKTVAWEIRKAETRASAYAIWNLVTDISTHQISNRKDREQVDARIAKVFVPANL